MDKQDKTNLEQLEELTNKLLSEEDEISSNGPMRSLTVADIVGPGETVTEEKLAAARELNKAGYLKRKNVCAAPSLRKYVSRSWYEHVTNKLNDRITMLEGIISDLTATETEF